MERPNHVLGDCTKFSLDNGNVTGDSAEKLLAAAKQKSKELGVAMNIAIVDTGANLVAFTRWANHLYIPYCYCPIMAKSQNQRY